jgi:transposase
MSFLTNQQKAELRARHKLERDRRICDRIKAVLLYDKGWSFEQIAEALLLSEGAIRNHIEEYQSDGKLIPSGGGSKEKLTERQSELLETHLSDVTYLYVKDIISYVYHRWKKRYTVAGMRNWLQRHNFSYKKPSLVPGKANLQQQEAWINAYQKLKANLPQNETICFTDGVHPTHNVQIAYGWIKKGESKPIASNTGRSRLNITGALDIFTHRLHIREDQTINALATIAFFKQLENAYPTMHKVHVFCDNAPYHRNKQVKEYLQTSKIQLHFLPPYSPNLNPIERLWKWMKETVMYNTHYEAFEAFREAIFGFLETVNRLPEDCEWGKQFRSQVRDRFRAVGSSC